MADQTITNVLTSAIPKIRGIPIFATVERILQPVTDFIRGNPIVSTAAIGAGTTGLIAAVATVRRRAKKPKKKKKKKKAKKKVRRRKPAKRKRKRKAPRKRRRRVIKGRGIGTHEIRHSGRSTTGRFKLVKFRDKRTGKMVSFKARR